MDLIFIVGVSFLAELFEVAWQYAPTFKESLEKIYRVYRKSIFLFLLMHTGYIFTLFISLKFDVLNFPIILAITLKSIDIFTKIELIKKFYLQERREDDDTLREILNQQTPIWLYLISPLTYPYIIYWAITWS